ncbi:MAG: HNH endonuclease [Brevibacterium yomogidense]
MCGDESVPLELDHIVGVAFGGSHSPWNTRLVCVPCHRGSSGSRVRERSLLAGSR